MTIYNLKQAQSDILAPHYAKLTEILSLGIFTLDVSDYYLDITSTVLTIGNILTSNGYSVTNELVRLHEDLGEGWRDDIDLLLNAIINSSYPLDSETKGAIVEYARERGAEIKTSSEVQGWTTYNRLRLKQEHYRSLIDYLYATKQTPME